MPAPRPANAQSALRGGGAGQPARARRPPASPASRPCSTSRRTEVRAPADGIVSQTDRLQVGAAAVTGVPVVTLVRSATTYVEANYKETDLANMYVGQPAEIELDAYPGLDDQRPCRQHRRRHRLAILGAARAECERQLGQGDASACRSASPSTAIPAGR